MPAMSYIVGAMSTVETIALLTAGFDTPGHRSMNGTRIAAS